MNTLVQQKIKCMRMVEERSCSEEEEEEAAAAA
jgi:hypothetical protein